ncbi:hypothetical protein BB558_003993 [Smittium angustum]|uniref:ER membrane protein complex subunit 6 n=1 Tax=Smittium angustum TaxID=133377 RepID=A0A2U1J4I9_SMIAN|nr:hypothetical protein BB558_003993 [Smittium angustum]
MSDIKVEKAYYEPIVNINNLTLSNIHTLTIWAAGATAGILGLVGYLGFVFFALCWLAITVAISAIKCRNEPSSHFRGGFKELLIGSIFGSLLTYILVWTLFYGLIYIYD